MANPPKRYYLPGLGADHRLFSDLQAITPGEVLAWPTPEASDTLESFAKKCAQSWNLQSPFQLVGFSFGGMVAKSMARLPDCNPAGVVMISSCRNARAVDPLFKKRVGYLKWLPDWLLRLGLVYVGPGFAKRGDQLTPQQSRALGDMAKETDLGFFRWAARVCATWQEGSAELPCPLLQIHGANDAVVPDHHGDADQTLANAGHLLTYTQPQQLADLIGSWSSNYT